jgi:hypothetical protein
LIERLKALLERNGVRNQAIDQLDRVKEFVAERQQNIAWERERGMRPPKGEDEEWKDI